MSDRPLAFTVLAGLLATTVRRVRRSERQLERRVAERDAVLAVLPDLFYVIDRAPKGSP